MATLTSTIGYVAVPKSGLPAGLWLDERGNVVQPSAGMLIDRDINDPGYDSDLARRKLVAVPIPGDSLFLRIIHQ